MCAGVCIYPWEKGSLHALSLSMGPAGRSGKVLKHWELLPGCFYAVQVICRKLASSEVTVQSLCNDCWSRRSMFFHLLCGVSQWMEGLISVLLALTLQWPQESSVKLRTSLKYFLHTVRDGTCLKDLAVSWRNTQYSHYHIKCEEVRHLWCLWFTPMCKVQSVSPDMQSSALPIVMISQPLEKMFRFD